MKKLRIKHLLVALLLLSPFAFCRAESRYSLEIGGESVVDTYISPLVYDGFRLGLNGYWDRQLSSLPYDIFMDGDVAFNASFAGRASSSSRLYGAFVRGGWGMNRTFTLPWQLSLSAGAGVGVEAGVLYLPTNGNNPASAKGYAGLHLKASLSRPFTFLKKKCRVRAEAMLPSVGIMFSPQYGQSYYEIYLGDRTGLVHCAWWGNRMRLISSLTFDIGLGPHTMTLGYSYGLLSSKVNSLNTRIISHSLSVGIIPGKL